MRDYQFFDQCVDKLTQDVYAQPPDPGHTEWAYEALDWIRTTIYVDKPVHQAKVLDIGCGSGFMSKAFEQWDFRWTGITIGDDYDLARDWLSKAGLDPFKVHRGDMTWLPFRDESFDGIFARHVLEHSPFPIITLMEWRRKVKDDGWLCLVAPAPHWWLYGGQNHYSIAEFDQIEWWLKRAGWNPIHNFVFDNRNPSFLKHLEVYQEAIRDVTTPEERHSVGKEILDRYPYGPVEFRFICEKVEEQIE